MVNYAFYKLSDLRIGSFFIKKLNVLKKVFARLHHPETLVENIIRHFIETKVTENVCSKQRLSDERDAPVPRIVLPFQD